jgi:CRP/FNR family transcriptional regulator, nitrogen fixation regulation protein
MARAGIAMKEVACKTDEAIYHYGDGAESIYQVVSGAVRTSKHFSDGQGRFATFHLPGEVFGLECGSIHGSAAKATIDSTLRLVKRSSIEQAAKLDAQVACELWSMTADQRNGVIQPNAAAWHERLTLPVGRYLADRDLRRRLFRRPWIAIIA